MRTDEMAVRNRGLWRALEWIARVQVAGVEAMARGLGVSPRQVRRYASRLEQQRLVVRSKIGDGGGGVLAVTPRGRRRAGYADGSRTTTRSLTGLLHGRGISWMAAHCDRSGRPWVGPGELRAEGWMVQLPRSILEGPRTHMPDLGFILDGEERWAAEFERVPKSRSRLARILGGYRDAELRGDLYAVLYVCADETIARLVRSVAEEVEVRCVLRKLERIIDEARHR
jgi:hypothetical protein